MIARLRRRLAILTRPDVIRDGHVYGGLLLAGLGGWQISRPWTCVAIGAIVAALGIFAPVGPRRAE